VLLPAPFCVGASDKAEIDVGVENRESGGNDLIPVPTNRTRGEVGVFGGLGEEGKKFLKVGGPIAKGWDAPIGDGS